MNAYESSRFQNIKRKKIPREGMPNDQRKRTGKAYPSANIICHPFQHSTPMSLSSLGVPLIYLQLKTDITEDVIDEYIKNTIVITVIIINLLKFNYFRKAYFTNFIMRIPNMKNAINRKGIVKVTKDFKISLFPPELSKLFSKQS